MSAVPAWLLEEETSEAAELQDVIGRAVDHALAGEPVDADVIASDLLRRQGDAMREVARLAESKATEIALATARISHRYDTQIARHQERASYYERGVLAIAESIDWSAQKKQSRAVGYGAYGVKREPERVKVLDQDKAVAWAREHFPGAVKTKITESVEHRVVAPAVIARVRVNGEIPDGFDVMAERDVFFAKPEID